MVVATLAASGAAVAQSDTEASAWNAAQRTGTADGYQRYLEVYPTGAHSNDAFITMVKLLVTETNRLGRMSRPRKIGQVQTESLY